jgi:hypothetical protein
VAAANNPSIKDGVRSFIVGGLFAIALSIFAARRAGQRILLACRDADDRKQCAARV